MSVVETTRKQLPTELYNGRLLCIVDGHFYDEEYKFLSGDNRGISKAVYSKYMLKDKDLDSNDYSNYHKVILKPHTLYNTRIDNAWLLLDSEYVWVYSDGDISGSDDLGHKYNHIDISVAKIVDGVLVDVSKEEVVKCIHIYSAEALANMVINMNMPITKYRLNLEIKFAKNSKRHLTIVGDKCSDIKFQFCNDMLLFLKDKEITDTIDNNTFIYVVNDNNFNYHDRYKEVANVLPPSKMPIKIFSLNGFILVMCACLDVECISRLTNVEQANSMFKSEQFIKDEEFNEYVHEQIQLSYRNRAVGNSSSFENLYSSAVKAMNK